MVADDIGQMIRRDFPVEVDADVESRSQDLFAFRRSRQFVPFQQLVRLAGDIDGRPLEGTEARPTYICGAPGMGKSSLSAYLSRRLRADAGNLVFTHFASCDRASSHHLSLVRRLLQQLRQWMAPTHLEVPESAEDLLRALPTWLALCGARHPGKRLFVILDAINQLQDVDEAHRLLWLPSRLPPNVHLLVTTTPQSPMSSRLQKRGWARVEMPATSLADRRSLVHAYLSRFGKRLEDDRVEKLVSLPQCGNPKYLLLLLDELRFMGDFEGLDRQLADLARAADISELYAKCLDRLQRSFDGALVEGFMTVVGTSRRGVTEQELLACLGVTQAALSPLLCALEEAFVSRGGMLHFKHASLEEAVERRYLASPQKREKVHRRMADFFLGDTVSEARRCEELGWHLAACEDMPALRRFLADVRHFDHLSSTTNGSLDLWSLWRQAGVSHAGRMCVSPAPALPPVSVWLCHVGRGSCVGGDAPARGAGARAGPGAGARASVGKEGR